MRVYREVMSRTEPKLGNYICIGVTQQIGEQPRWQFKRRKIRIGHARHSGRRVKRLRTGQ